MMSPKNLHPAWMPAACRDVALPLRTGFDPAVSFPRHHAAPSSASRADSFQTESKIVVLSASEPSTVCAIVSVVAGWKDHLDKPGTICALIRVEGCALVRSNALQCQRALVLRRRVRCNSAETDNGHSNQHCCDETQGGFGADV